MNTLVVVALLVAVAAAAPLTSDKDAVTLEHKNDNIGTGPYQVRFETSNGIKAGEEGQLENEGTADEAEEVRGFYEYIANTGELIRVDYTAGRNGYRASGTHLPKLP